MTRFSPAARDHLMFSTVAKPGAECERHHTRNNLGLVEEVANWGIGDEITPSLESHQGNL